jgi:hypothetical protein
MRPEHYSRHIAQRCGSLVRHLLPLIQKGLPDDAKFGGPLDNHIPLGDGFRLSDLHVFSI